MVCSFTPPQSERELRMKRAFEEPEKTFSFMFMQNVESMGAGGWGPPAVHRQCSGRPHSSLYCTFRIINSPFLIRSS